MLWENYIQVKLVLEKLIAPRHKKYGQSLILINPIHDTTTKDNSFFIGLLTN